MKKICYISTIAVSVRAFLIPQLKYLAENGFDVTVICSPDDTLQTELGDSVKFIPVEIARGIYPLTLKKSISDLKKIFKEHKFDIVQYLTPNASFVASIAAKIAGVKTRNYHLMGLRYIGEQGVKRSILKLIEKMTCWNSTHIECVSKSNLKLAIKEKIFPPKKATVVWNGSTGGIDLVRFDHKKRNEYRTEIRKELKISTDEFVFGFVGRITKDKGIDELLEAFQKTNGKSKLLIIGPKEGICTLNSELWSAAHNNDKIIILDAVKNIEKYYSAIDVLLLPSYREGFGMVIAEAAAMGTPAIISNIPGPVDAVIPGETAKLVEAKNATSLCNAMEEFLENKNLAKDMSARTYDFVLNHFDSEKLNKKILERKLLLLDEK